MSCQGRHTWKVPESGLGLRFLASIVAQFSLSTTQLRLKSINCCGHTTFPTPSNIFSSQVRNFLPFFPELETAGNQAAHSLCFPPELTSFWLPGSCLTNNNVASGRHPVIKVCWTCFLDHLSRSDTLNKPGPCTYTGKLIWSSNLK